MRNDPVNEPRTEDTHRSTTDAPDAGDEVKGAVGGVSRQEPPASGAIAADLDELPSLDGPGAAPSPAREDAPRDSDPSVHGRQDPDHVGVDWDLTARTRD
jgi:hypothetical protein